MLQDKVHVDVMLATAKVVDKLVEYKAIQSYDDLAIIAYVNSIYLR